MKSFFTLLAFLCLFEYVFADEMYSPDINGLYDASLIVTGTPQLKNGEVEFSILNVLKNSSGESYNSQSSVHFSPTRYGVLSMMNPQTVADTINSLFTQIQREMVYLWRFTTNSFSKKWANTV